MMYYPVMPVSLHHSDFYWLVTCLSITVDNERPIWRKYDSEVLIKSDHRRSTLWVVRSRAIRASIGKLRIIQHNFKNVSLPRILAEPRVWCPDRSLNNIAVCKGVGESSNRKGRKREETAK